MPAACARGKTVRFGRGRGNGVLHRHSPSLEVAAPTQRRGPPAPRRWPGCWKWTRPAFRRVPKRAAARRRKPSSQEGWPRQAALRRKAGDWVPVLVGRVCGQKFTAGKVLTRVTGASVVGNAQGRRPAWRDRALHLMTWGKDGALPQRHPDLRFGASSYQPLIRTALSA